MRLGTDLSLNIWSYRLFEGNHLELDEVVCLSSFLAKLIVVL